MAPPLEVLTAQRLVSTSRIVRVQKVDDSQPKGQNPIRNCGLISPLALGSTGVPNQRSAQNMLFDGSELREIIGRTPNEIELRNEHGRCCRLLSTAEALGLDLNLFIGVGNRRRIRFLRSRTRRFAVNAGSHTTQRLKGEAGLNIAHPLVREHRLVRRK